jgi:hypothetical protein
MENHEATAVQRLHGPGVQPAIPQHPLCCTAGEPTTACGRLAPETPANEAEKIMVFKDGYVGRLAIDWATVR